MSTVQELRAAITQLEPRNIHAVADWLRNTVKNCGTSRLVRTPKPESLTRSLRKPKPVIARARPRPFREVSRAAGVLGVLRATAAQGSEDRAQEFSALAKAPQSEIPRLQTNDVDLGRCGRARAFARWRLSMMAVTFGFGSAHTMDTNGFCAGFGQPAGARAEPSTVATMFARSHGRGSGQPGQA